MQTLSDHILDIAQNSIRAKASRVEIDLQENLTNDSLVISIKDNGCGMDATTLAKVTDPFFTSRTVRKVGLGIPLFKQNAEATGGSLVIESKPGEGTTTAATFTLSHWDRPPMGDIAGSIVILVESIPSLILPDQFSTMGRIAERFEEHKLTAVMLSMGGWLLLNGLLAALMDRRVQRMDIEFSGKE